MSNSPWTRNRLTLPLRVTLSFAAAALVLFAGAIGSFGQSATNFAIGTTPLRQDVLRLGVNLGGQDYYDSGQMLRNLIQRNPGFEQEQWQSVVDCVAVTATSCTDGNLWNFWPANFLAGATFQVMNGPNQGETGTISANTVSDAETGSSNPSHGITVTFSSPLSAPLAVGDYLRVTMQKPGNPTAGWWTSTSGGATLTADTTDIASDSSGKQALEISASGSGQSGSVTSYFDSSSGRSFIQLNGTYTLTFKAKGLGGSNNLKILIQRSGTPKHGNVTYLSQTVNLSGQWQDYSYTFTANEDGTYIGTVQAAFSAAGASLYLDDVALTEAAASDNPTAYRNAVVDRLRELRPGVIRLNTTQDIGSTIDNELAVPFARHPAGWSSGVTEQDDIPMGLHEFLVLCQAVGAEPWFSMSGETSPTDMQHLIEYLSGDASTPYGAIRAALGQNAPWTTVFPVIHLELGNEMWNSMMGGESIQDPVAYGQITSSAFKAARSSPYYNSSSFDLVMGSWAAVPWWTQQELANSSGYDSVDAAPYLFYTLSDYSSNEAMFGPMFAQPEQLDSTSGGYMAQQAQMAAAGSPPAKLEIYEVNLSTISGTAPENVVNQAVGGVASGITVADHMLLMMRDLGVTVQNLYALSGYVNTFSNTATGSNETMPLWASTIDMGGETNANRPTFLGEELANQAILPTMLAVSVTGANPTWNQPQSANDTVTPIQLANAHYLQSFAFTDGTHYSIVVFNLSRSGSLPITFSGANAPTGNVLISQLTSTNPTDNNEGLTANNPVVNTTQTNVSGFNPSTAYSLPPFSMTVFQWPNASLPPTTTTLGANPTSVNAGASVALTAAVAAQSGSNTPTGTVTFMNGSTTVGTATVNATGTATLNTTALPPGTDSVTASYGGDSKDGSSVSSAVNVTVTSSALPTTTSLTASPTTANTAQTVTLTATVAPKSGSSVPQGSVTFLNGTTSLGNATLNGSGVAVLTSTSLPAGTDSISASYAGNTSDAASVSTAVTVTLTQTVSTTTTALTASATQITPGQSVTLMATVTPQSGSTPSGTVTFLNGTTTLGTGTLNSSGSASFSTSALPAGKNSITASYAGTKSDSASVSPAVTITVAQNSVGTTTTLSSSAPSINTGQSVTFTATVAQQSGTTTPTGTVTYLNGTAIVGTSSLNSSGVAIFSTTALPAGTDSITASYGGTTGLNSSVSAAVAVTVNQTQIATTTTLALSATQIVVGQSLTLTATVSPQSGSAPRGTVTFLDGATPVGTASLTGRGTASFSTSNLTAGTHSLSVSYAGSTSNSGSSSAAQQVQVNPAPVHTTTSLVSSSNAVNTGQSVTFTATVTPQTSGSTLAILPVAFLDGSTIIGTANVNASGVATFTTALLPAGSDSITASYTGNTTDLSSVSNPVIIQVAQTVAATTTALTASASQIGTDSNVVFTATVLPSSGGRSPRGTITFLDGTAPLGTAVLNNAGIAFFGTSKLAAGTHQITASYAGNTTDSSSVSAPVAVAVVQSIQATTTTLAASAMQIASGANVMLTASVSQRGGGAISSGAVTFLDGSGILASTQLSASGVATLNTHTLGIGTHSIIASFAGSASESSSSSAPISIIVLPGQSSGQSATTISLTASATQITAGQSATFTAVLASSSGNNAPSGNVTFFDGSNQLGVSGIDGSGVASYTTSGLTAGTHTITASYSGNNQAEGATSSPLTIIVVQQAAAPAPVSAATSTTLTASASQVTVGDPVTLTATVADQTGNGMPGGTVQFLDGANPIGSASLSSGGTATFTAPSLATGTHSITAAYGGDASNGASTSAATNITVTAAGTPGYTMSVSSSDVSVKPGVVANLTVTLTPENGFNQTVDLTCSSPLKGTTCSFSPPSVTPNGGPVTSTLSILVASSNTVSAENQKPPVPFDHRMALGMVMPWGIFSLLGLSRRKNRSRAKAWSIRIIVAVALTAGSLWMSGCGYHVNNSNFTMTLTSSGQNAPTHTSQIIVNVTQ